MTRRRFTADELRRLVRSGKFVEEEIANPKLRQFAAEMHEAEQPLLEDIRSSGKDLHSVWDLVGTQEPYHTLVPILLKHLQRPYPDRIKEGIARALAIPEAIVGWKVLVDAFRADPDREGMGAKAGVALALAAAANDSVMPEIVQLLREREHGQNRAFLLNALRRSNDPQAIKVLMELGSDEQLARDAQKVLRQRAKSRKLR